MKDFLKKGASSGALLKTEAGMSRQGILLTMLVIIAGAGGIIFYTDMIKPGSGTGAPESNQLLVKKPMPPRPEIKVAANQEKPAAEHQQASAPPERKTGAEKSTPVAISTEHKPSPLQQSGTKLNAAKPEPAEPTKGHVNRTIPTKPVTAAVRDAKVKSAKGTEKTAIKKVENEQDGLGLLRHRQEAFNGDALICHDTE